MTRSVTIKDDSLRANKVIMITPEMRRQFLMAGNPIPKGYTFLPAIDERTKCKVQDKVVVDRVFADEHLDNVIKRAKRYIRSSKFADRVPAPRHIEFALMVFNKYDKPGFADAVKHALA